MTKLVLVILTLYVIYYAGNILFDLFFDKSNTQKYEQTDQFLIHEFEKEHQTKPKSISIEDVENLMTPDSFSKTNFKSVTDENREERQDIDYWRGLFESEQSIEEFVDIDKIEYKQNSKSNEHFEEPVLENPTVENEKLDIGRIHNKEKWFQLMTLAETTVQLISNTNGHKVYHSSAF